MHHSTIRLLILVLLAGTLRSVAATDGPSTGLPRNLTQQALLDRYATSDSNFAYLNGTMVHYQDQGAGPAVLLIHGSLQDLYDWDDWAASLSDAYRVIRLDLPAAGLTGPVSSFDYSIENTLRTIDALMNKLDEAQFAVVGTSLGGIHAFRYAATRPERVAALVLMNAAGVEWGNEKIIPPQPQRYNESLAKTISRESLEIIMAAVIPDARDIPPGRIDRGLDYQRRIGRNKESSALIEAYDRGDPAAMLGRIKAPALVLWGAENEALDPAVADEFVRLLRCSKFVEKMLVPGTGHWPHVEAAKDSVRFVEDFFSRQYVAGEDYSDRNCNPQ